MGAAWTAVWDSPRPHVHPLRTLGGRLLTVDAPADHPWHHGLWSTIKFVNSENFWETYGEYGTLVTTDVAKADGRVEASIDWVAPGGEAIAVHETRELRTIEFGDHYAIDWTFALRPTVDTEFDRTPFTTWGGYGGLTLRGAPDWTDTALVLPDGTPRDRVLGEPAPWCALRSDAATIVIMDDPANVRFPTPWYGSNRAETYGEGWANFVNAAFLWDEPLRVRAGDTLRRRHRVVVADGAMPTDRIAEDFAAWSP